MRGVLRLILTTIILGCASLTLNGCAEGNTQGFLEQTPSEVEAARITIHEADYSAEVPTSQLDKAGLQAVADRYLHHSGHGPVEMTVSYNPGSRTNTAGRAADAAAHMAAILKQNGVANVIADTLPAAQGEVSKTLISYKVVIAQAPADCQPMPGLDGQPTDTNFNSKYKLGCALDAQIAAQVANPADLAGRTVEDMGSGRRQANIIEVYQKGAPNPPMQNLETASGTTQ